MASATMTSAFPCERYSGADRRRAQRKTTFASGQVHCQGTAFFIPCKVVDFSSSGARLVFTPEMARYQVGAIKNPGNIKLVLVSERSEVDCAVVWRAGQEMGVRLNSNLRPRKSA